ncbi:MAG: preprotein translocase subunit SecE [Marinifilaceae bacterium]|nr:preprotein translocase subunit SecE [Marinilabiliaceae bacterium JC040]MCT4599368.1 preprotein translocase subunit SecE [Marinifilaceae bacterium]
MRSTNYIKEVYRELIEKVSWPSWPELVSSSTIVMVASAIIAFLIFVMDYGFKFIMDNVYSLFY